MADGKRTLGKVWARPGVKGAVQDLVESVAKAAAPRSVAQRKQALQQAEEASLGRMREGQSTDSNNRY